LRFGNNAGSDVVDWGGGGAAATGGGLGVAEGLRGRGVARGSVGVSDFSVEKIRALLQALSPVFKTALTVH
jgi:hypothetical protein